MFALSSITLGVLGVLAIHSAASAAELRDIRCMGGHDYTRLVLDLSESTTFQIRQLPGRVYVDLTSARRTGEPPAPTCRGPLARTQLVRTDQGLRLVLDVPGLTGARAFPLLDPFRLVVDVEAIAAVAPTPAAALSANVQNANRATRSAAHVTIVLDPGHGGKDPGAQGVGGIQEKDVVLAIALKLREQLQALPNVTVLLTRERDVFLSLEERTALANAERADLFVSIHANASTNPVTSGIETYYLNNTDDRATLRLAAMENGVASVTGRRLRGREVTQLLSSLIQDYKVAQSATFAATVQAEVVGAVAAQWPRVVDLGVKQGPFYVLVGAGMPCLLVEVSFVTHPQEGAYLAQPAYREALSQGLLRGIRHFIAQRQSAGTL